jgi:hypothetical protein
VSEDTVVRICNRVAELKCTPSPNAVTDRCSRCREPVYVDLGQPSPYPHLTELFICVECGLGDAELGVPVAGVLLDIAASMLFSAGEEEATAMGKHAGTPNDKPPAPDGTGGGKREKPSPGGGLPPGEGKSSAPLTQLRRVAGF